MRQRPPKSTRTCTLCPYTTLFLSAARCRLPLPLASESIGVVVLQHVAATGRSRSELFEECARVLAPGGRLWRSEEHTSELQSLMRISYDVFCLKKKTNHNRTQNNITSVYTLLTKKTIHLTVT